MKIAQIHYTGFGGLAAVVNAMVTAPSAESHEWIMGYYGVPPLDASQIEFCNHLGFDFAVFRPKDRNPWKAWYHLYSWLLSEKPDAIICHSITAIPPCSCVARRRKIPLIVVEHTPNEIKSKTEWLGSLSAMLMADRVIVLTKVYAAILKMKLGPSYDSRKVRLIPNGVSTTTFHPPLAAKAPSDTLRAGMAARLTSEKRHDLLIDVSNKLGFTFDIAGDGVCIDILMARANACPSSAVSFSGLVPDTEMPEWFRGIDLYIHASSGETFSMAILQAMASGLPIIASDISGMEEVIGCDSECGLLVPNTFEAWTEAISSLISNPDLRVRMGIAARKRSERFFSASTMLCGYIHQLEELMAE